MSRRLKKLILSSVLIICLIAAYLALMHLSKDEWLKDYLYEVYGGEEWVKIGGDGKYYAYRAPFPEVTYKNGVFKADKAHEHCLQPERNYYEGDDIIMTTNKAVYKYGEEVIIFTITNNSDKTIWPTGHVFYDIEVNANGQWYAIYLWNAYAYGLISDSELNPGQKLEVYIPIYIQGSSYFDIYMSGIAYTEPNYYKLRPGLYRLVHRVSLLPQGKKLDLTYLTCTFEIKK